MHIHVKNKEKGAILCKLDKKNNNNNFLLENKKDNDNKISVFFQAYFSKYFFFHFMYGMDTKKNFFVNNNCVFKKCLCIIFCIVHYGYLQREKKNK